ncbi:synaptopodin-2 [Chanos chanos]|uniref:Synaptopodin-2 n=1 Tax=Chanos chanos TaxID=29144 RepID=A0A6J2VSY3_CHACN|nr:synaptopodin-2-like [Chanos chanos]
MMGIGDYICITVHGGAPWGFQIRERDESHHPLQVFQIEEASPASLAGLCEDDEIISINGESCANLTLPEAISLIEASTDSLQLLVKSCCKQPIGEVFKSTAHVIPSPYKSQAPRELYISESQDEAYYGETDSDAECPGGSRSVQTQFCIPAPRHQAGTDSQGSRVGGNQLELTPGSVVELQLSLSKQSLEEPSCTSLGSARGVEGYVHHKETVEAISSTVTTSCSLYIPRQEREPLGQRAVLVRSPSSMLGQVEVTLQHPSGRGSEKEGADTSVPESNISGQLDDGGQEEGGCDEGAPASSISTVCFEIPSDEWESESDRENNKPNRHRARHARLRRSESLSEKQVKEAKSKCKRIALLLTASVPNPNNKGLLMFKRHRQRAKKYTLVSYGTGEDEPEYEDEEGEEKTHSVNFTLLTPSESDFDDSFFTNAQSQRSVVTFDFDAGLLEIERKLENQEEMEKLPETKGKGALMFAQRRQRIDEITAEHEEMRRQGLPVEGVHEAEQQVAYQQIEEHSYKQSSEGQNYMDVSAHHQQQPQYQQYQEPYYHQQQQQHHQEYQQNIQYQQQQQQYQQHQEYHQQQQYQQHQQYQQQQQMQQYSSHNMNGISHHQAIDMQSSITNRSAKPFSVQNRVPAPFSPTLSGANQEQSSYSPVGQGEQIASRDERISVPAIKTGILQDARKRHTAKPMFTFKEPPKVSPNPVLLNLLNRSERKLGFESGPEEDYLSLGAEACNFLQSPNVKHKIPPPVAPKPHINPASPPWSQAEIANQEFPQPTENNGEAPAPEFTAAPEMEASPAAAHEPSPPSAPEPQEDPLKPPTPEQPETVHAWSPPEPQMQPAQQPEAWNDNQPQQQISAPVSLPPAQVQAHQEAPVSTWSPNQPQVHQQPPVSVWGPTEGHPQTSTQTQSHSQPPWITQAQTSQEVQSQATIQTQSQPQPPWVTQTQAQLQHQHQSQTPTNAWAPAQCQSTLQPSWVQPQEQAQPPISAWAPAQNQTQPPWVQQPQHESQPLPPWATPPQHQPQPSWPQAQSQPQPQPPWVSQAQPQPPAQPPVNTWPQPQSPVQAQPPWVQQAQPAPQAPTHMQSNMNSWGPVPAQSQPQPPWAQQQQQPPQEHSQQKMNTWAPEQDQVQTAWAQPQPSTQTQSQPPWAHQPQQQAPPQPPVSQWAPPQSQPDQQPPIGSWTPQAQQPPMSTMAPSETPKTPPQSIKPWNQSPAPARPPAQRMNSYTPGTKIPSPTPMGSSFSSPGAGSSFEMPALRGKGAELFAKRQSRMEKFVVDSATVQANKARPTSPTPSLPNSWKYSPNCRAPPPLAYNPLQSPSYPPGAIKQPPSSSPSAKAKNKSKEKEKPPPKPLHVLDVMRHQPYQLNSSLFTYGPAAEKLAAEKEAAEKLAAEKRAAEEAAQAQAQAQAHAAAMANQNQHVMYDQSPVQPSGQINVPYGFIPQQPHQPQQQYGMAVNSPSLHDGSYHQAPINAYQQPPNTYPPALHQQGPYQQAYNPSYQQVPANPYEQPPSPPYQQAPQPPYQPGPNPPYPPAPLPSYQPSPSSYVVPSFPVGTKAESSSGATIVAAPKPKFSAKKSNAQVWKPSTAEIDEYARSSSLSPSARLSPVGLSSRAASASPITRPIPQAKPLQAERQVFRLDKSHKPPTPWEAAARHPLGLVDEAFAFQSLPQSIASSVHSAAQRKLLPEPPAEWKAKVAYEPPPKSQGFVPNRSPQSFCSPTKSTASAPATPMPYGSPVRQPQPQRSMTEVNLGSSSWTHQETKRPPGQPGYRSAYKTYWRQ